MGKLEKKVSTSQRAAQKLLKWAKDIRRRDEVTHDFNIKKVQNDYSMQNLAPGCALYYRNNYVLMTIYMSWTYL
jgi:hypothetical protein